MNLLQWSFIKRLAVLAVFASVLFSAPAIAQNFGLGFGRLVSPGDLAQAHHEFDSITKCIECHDLTGGVSEDKCLGCHKAIFLRIKAHKGFHSHSKVTQKKCVKCHNDHKGKTFKIIAWPSGDIKNFDHEMAGYRLRDKHKKTLCKTCHDKKNKSGSITYLGLAKECSSCHKDVHEKTLGQTCNDCHVNEKSFKGQDVKFNHDESAKFRLDGKHTEVACGKCHTGTNNKKALFKIEKYEKCKTCHLKDDLHKGRLGNDCESCHITGSWKKATRFRHDKTRFALKGKHVGLKCKTCHTKGEKDFTIAKFDGCADSGCHDIAKRGAIHGKQFSGRKCEECHKVSGFSPATFKHSSVHYKGFKLRGKHAKVKCSKCHKGDGSFTLFKKRKPRILYRPIQNNTCNAKGCHDHASKTGKTHGEQFKGYKCEKCHVEKSWKPSTFDHNDPDYTGFKLIGKHASVKCANCHTKSKNGKVLYKPIEHKTCNGAGCHDLPKRGAIHIGQFKEKDCADCHTEKSWKPTLFSHSSKEYDGYKLLGKHASIKCTKCHTPDGKTVRHGKTDRKVVHYEPIATETCNGKGCHDNRPHNGMFKTKNCDECHVVTGFDDMKTNFDHTLDTLFPLTGKHITAKCTNCHKKSGGKPKWKPTDEDCVSCHKKDDKHKGRLGEGCDDCHHTSSWNPKVVAHQATGFPLKETHAQLLCSDCHTRGKGDYSGLSPDCQQCHTDPHLNQMGRLCNDCHTMRNWEPSRFKHSMTGFRLEGSHRFATCDSCHKNRIYRTISSDCYSCHQKDFFRGAIFHTPGRTDCTECHNVYAFKPARNFVHRSMTFSGTHAAIKNDCTKCHIKTSAGYAPKFPGASTEQNCFSCHSADYARRHRNCPITCTLCHNTTAFQGAVKKIPCD